MDRELTAQTDESRRIDPLVLQRVHLSLYYKQHLATANEAQWLATAARTVHYIGGIDNANRPCPFLACLVRLVELAPETEIVELLLSQPHFKYVSAIALAYVRLTQPSPTVFQHVPAFTSDYRKLRQYLSVPETVAGTTRNYGITYLDSFADDLLHNHRLYGIWLPRLPRPPPVACDPGLSSELSESEHVQPPADPADSDSD